MSVRAVEETHVTNRIDAAIPLQMRMKDDRAPDVIVNTSEREHDDPFSGIRCPRCRWRPVGTSRWCCEAVGSPEPLFDSCGTTWNTFATRGRCPGCGHQWLWTSCHACEGWSLHEDWYEREQGRDEVGS